MSGSESYRGSSSEGMSSNTQYSNSTPFKSNSRSGPRLSATKERQLLDNPAVDPQFAEHFFVALDTIPTVEDDSIAQLITIISSAHGEKNIYNELVQILDKIARLVCTIGYSSSSPTTLPLHFLCSYTQGPSSKNKQQTHHIAPDILVFPPLTVSQKFLQKAESKNDDPSSFSLRCPWAVLESIIEGKPKKKWDHKQTVDYLEILLQHRPDKTSALGLSCNQFGYRFYYVDACTQKTSIVFPWKDGLTPLVHYVYSLHKIFTDNIQRDTSIQLHDITWKKSYSSAIWGISFKGEEYKIRSIFERKGLGRRTWIAVGSVNNSDKAVEDVRSKTTSIRVVKDMWRDNSRRYEEGSLLQRIHEKGFVPGIVRPIAEGSFNLSTKNRTKHRLIMGSTGLRLSVCKSVLEFLKIMYDAIEAHERAVERGVLHRDVSWYNVLCRPQHYIGHKNVVDHPNIGTILAEPDPQPLCLLTDFDNAALLQDDKGPGEGTKRTGTPMFMACELAYKKIGFRILRIASHSSPPIVPSQFHLEGEVLNKYINTYKRERYEEYNTLLTSVVAGHMPEVDPFAAGNPVPAHQPHHDVESMYWIMLWFLAKAWPTGTEPYPDSEDGDAEYQKDILQTVYSRMMPNHMARSVIKLVPCPEAEWRVSLHPAFRSLAKLLSDMGSYICMCWSRFPDMPFWHSHEVFKRLLLKEIVRMSEDGTPIPIQGPKPPFSKTSSGSSRMSTGKLGGGTMTTRLESLLTPSGSRSQVGESTQSRQSRQTTKRARSNSVSANSGGLAKKQRSSHESVAHVPTEICNDDFVSVCLQNIEDDDTAWFAL